MSAFFVPVYTSHGEALAFLAYPYLFNTSGEWIGFVTPERAVYSVHGHYVGDLTDDPRILRRASDSYDRPRLKLPPPPQGKFYPPANVPVAPMMAELRFGFIDVLQDCFDLLPPVDFGDLRPDMD
jgi:hypothetical protein